MQKNLVVISRGRSAAPACRLGGHLKSIVDGRADAWSGLGSLAKTLLRA